ncbi:MAG: hypothetical protein M9921_13095 [Fimbriimonadaceae bacterium]|nr:hypothetical protein [Fimbriimonadaceae bacterium]
MKSMTLAEAFSFLPPYDVLGGARLLRDRRTISAAEYAEIMWHLAFRLAEAAVDWLDPEGLRIHVEKRYLLLHKWNEETKEWADDKSEARFVELLHQHEAAFEGTIEALFRAWGEPVPAIDLRDAGRRPIELRGHTIPWPDGRAIDDWRGDATFHPDECAAVKASA